jgi:hypothetical protein
MRPRYLLPVLRHLLSTNVCVELGSEKDNTITKRFLDAVIFGRSCQCHRLGNFDAYFRLFFCLHQNRSVAAQVFICITLTVAVTLLGILPNSLSHRTAAKIS